MANWKLYCDGLGVDIGDKHYSTYRQGERLGYLVGVDYAAEEGGHFVRVFEPAFELPKSNRDAATMLKEGGRAEAIHADGFKEFPLEDFMDSSRVVENIQKSVDNGATTGHAMNVAMLAEYGIIGINGNEFAHRYGFEELTAKLKATFPEGPPRASSQRSSGASISVDINTETGVVSSEHLRAPAAVDTRSALLRFADDTIGRKHLVALDT